MLYCLLKEYRVLVFKKTEVFYNGNVEELIELAKSEGIELTKEEAEAYMAEMEDVELDSDTLKQVAGGGMSYCSDLFTFKKAPEGCPNLEASR